MIKKRTKKSIRKPLRFDPASKSKMYAYIEIAQRTFSVWQNEQFGNGRAKVANALLAGWNVKCIDPTVTKYLNIEVTDEIKEKIKEATGFDIDIIKNAKNESSRFSNRPTFVEVLLLGIDAQYQRGKND